MRHELKTEHRWFANVLYGEKTAELRRDDRGFALDDVLHLIEIDDGRPTGRTLDKRVTHIVRADDGPWLAPGYCMLSLGPVSVADNT